MNTKFFIPQVIEVQGVKIPSTPFKAKGDVTIFLGDVFELSHDEGDAKDVYVAQIKDGQYLGLTDDPNKDAPLWLLEPDDVVVLGSSIEKPELLNLLSK